MQLLFVVRLKYSEDLGGGNELRRHEFLAADHQNVVVRESAVERTPRPTIDWLCEVEAANFRPGVLRQRGDRISHEPVAPLFFYPHEQYGDPPASLAIFSPDCHKAATLLASGSQTPDNAVLAPL